MLKSIKFHCYLGGLLAALGASAALAVGPTVGPATSEKYDPQTGVAQLDLPAVTTSTKLSVVIPVFDPAIAEEERPKPYHKDEKWGMVWDEIRRTESNLLAVGLRDNFARTGYFDKVRVTPNSQAIGELYIMGRIMRSTGEDLHLEITVTDISQYNWISPKIYELRVEERDVTESARLRGVDPYQPLYDEVVRDVVTRLAKRSEQELQALRGVGDMVFASSYSVETFGKYLGTEKKGPRNARVQVTALKGKPASNDLQYQRILDVRAKEELFLDDLQPNYDQFAGRIESAYQDWQVEAYPLAVEARKARRGRNAKIGGALALAILGGATGSEANEAKTAAIAGAAALGYSAFRTSGRYAAITDSLSELGDSVNIQLASSNIEFEGKTATLEGNAAEQYQQVRRFLQAAYEAEATPDVQLQVSD